jgi:hypothetical protein
MGGDLSPDQLIPGQVTCQFFRARVPAEPPGDPSLAKGAQHLAGANEELFQEEGLQAVLLAAQDVAVGTGSGETVGVGSKAPPVNPTVKSGSTNTVSATQTPHSTWARMLWSMSTELGSFSWSRQRIARSQLSKESTCPPPPTSRQDSMLKREIQIPNG